MAQPQHYGPFLYLNCEAGSKAVIAALTAGSAIFIGDASDLNFAWVMLVLCRLTCVLRSVKPRIRVFRSVR